MKIIINRLLQRLQKCKANSNTLISSMTATRESKSPYLINLVTAMEHTMERQSILTDKWKGNQSPLTSLVTATMEKQSISTDQFSDCYNGKVIHPHFPV
jgi:site-specific recombinase